MPPGGIGFGVGVADDGLDQGAQGTRQSDRREFALRPIWRRLADQVGLGRDVPSDLLRRRALGP